MNSELAKELLTIYPLGTQIQFDHYLRKWQMDDTPKDITENIPKDIPNLESLQLLTKSSQSNYHIFGLDDSLEKSSRGTMILDYYKANQKLNLACSNILVDIIISYVIDNKIPMFIGLANYIADTVVHTFKFELKDIYFYKDNHNKFPRGKIYNKYFNVMKMLKHYGLYSTKNHEKNDAVCTLRSYSKLDDSIDMEKPMI